MKDAIQRVKNLIEREKSRIEAARGSSAIEVLEELLKELETWANHTK